MQITHRVVAYTFTITAALLAIGAYTTGESAGQYLNCLGWSVFYALVLTSTAGVLWSIYATTRYRPGRWITSWKMLSRIGWSSRIGIGFGLGLLIFSVLPPLYMSCPFSSPAPSDMVVDAAIIPHARNPPNPIIHDTELDFEVSQGAVFATFTFSNVLSNSTMLVALPFPIGNVSQGPNIVLPGFSPVFHNGVQITQYEWVENVTFRGTTQNPTSTSLNGTLSMALHLTSDMMRVGPWQNSLILSIGSGTSPLCFRFPWCGVLLRSNVTVGVTFPQNQIIGSGTFPTPSWITTNQYARIVAWRFPSSDHFNDLQLFLEAASFSGSWPFEPLPTSWQPIALAAAFVMLQVSLTRAIGQMIRNRPNKDRSAIADQSTSSTFI